MISITDAHVPREPPAPEVASWLEEIMFSKENRMATFLICMIVLVGLFTIWAAMTIQIQAAGTDQYKTYVVAGIGLLIVKSFLSILLSFIAARKAAEAGREVRNTSQRIEEKVQEIDRKTNGNVETAMEEVRLAEKDQVINDPQIMVRLEQLVWKVVQEYEKRKERGKGPPE